MFFFQKLKHQIRYFQRYIKYLILSRHRGGHGIHSPFVFRFYQQVLGKKLNREEKQKLRGFIEYFLKDKTIIYCPELGAPSRMKQGERLKVSQLARMSSVSFKYGKVLYFLAAFLKPDTILELGTSIGMSALYLSLGSPGSRIYSIEGCKEKVAYAQNVFEQFGLDQIIVKQGVFNQLLPNVIQSAGKLDMVFLDGDHTYKGTLGYFEQITAKAHNETVVVLDDIHWSAEMEAAWKHIQQKDEVTVSIDLFRVGIIFFKKELSKQNFMIKY